MKFKNYRLEKLNKKYKDKYVFWDKVTMLFVSFIITFILALSAFFIVFYQSDVIGPSMQPTYNVLAPDSDNENAIISSPYRDHIIVSRFRKPKNGEVAIVELTSQTIIKRVLASGGQTLLLKKNIEDDYYSFYVDGTKLEEDYIKDPSAMNERYMRNFASSAGSGIYKNVTLRKDEFGHDMIEIVIPQGYYYVAGDNRANSYDSKDLGLIESSKIRGTVVLHYAYNDSLIGVAFRSVVALFK